MKNDQLENIDQEIEKTEVIKPERIKSDKRVLDREDIQFDERVFDRGDGKSIERSFERVAELPGKLTHPKLTAVHVPVVFEANMLLAPTMYFAVEGEDFDPLSTDDVKLQVLDGDSKPVEAVFTHTMTIQDLLFGRETAGLLVIESELVAGSYQLCASILSINEALICAPFELVYAQPTGCTKEFLQAVKKGLGCRCKSGEIRTSPRKSPDKSLGSFTKIVGGNIFGSFKKGSVLVAGPPAPGGNKITSVMKFEAHFEAEAVNDPGKPAKCTDQEWQALITGFLCTEGQNINNTLVYNAGASNETKRYQKGPDPDKKDQEKDFPYIAKTKDPKKFTQDGHGYQSPGLSKSKSVKGKLKAYDTDLVIHWLDAPGISNKDAKPFQFFFPFYQESRFHTFVHGSSGKDKDNCDCYFDTRTGVIDAKGNAADSKITSKPICSK